jgi:glycosyltransferase involved in cell wall biosynthesis
MTGALVSVIVPTYNRAHLIGESIQSVLDQTYGPWELIIVDDGSTDETFSLLANHPDSRIRYYKMDHCGIIGRVRNEGMKYAKGSYIAFLDSDDLWRKDKLEFQFALLNKYREASFITSNGVHFGEDQSLPAQLENLFVGNAFLPMLEEERFIFFVPSLLFERRAIEEIGTIDETLISGGDIDFYFRMARKFTGIFTNERLVRIRKHQSTSQALETVAYVEFIGMLKRFFAEKAITKKQYSKILSKQYYGLGLVFLRKKQFNDSFRNFLKYNRLRPANYKGWIRLIQSFGLAVLTGMKN